VIEPYITTTDRTESTDVSLRTAAFLPLRSNFQLRSSTMLHSSKESPQGKRKDAFTSVAIAVCLVGQNAMQNTSFKHIQAEVKRSR